MYGDIYDDLLGTAESVYRKTAANLSEPNQEESDGIERYLLQEELDPIIDQLEMAYVQQGKELPSDEELNAMAEKLLQRRKKRNYGHRWDRRFRDPTDSS